MIVIEEYNYLHNITNSNSNKTGKIKQAHQYSINKYFQKILNSTLNFTHGFTLINRLK